MRIGKYRLSVAWAPLAFVILLVAFFLWYYFDARSASPGMENLLLIRPAVFLALAICCLIIVQELHIARERSSGGEDQKSPAPSPEATREQSSAAEEHPFLSPERTKLLRIFLLMLLLGGYVFSMEKIGFDLATFLFMALSFVVQGEFRLSILIGYSLVYSLLLTWAIKMMLTVPVPTLLL